MNRQLVATENFTARDDHGEFVVRAGLTRLAAEHPLARERPHCFALDQARPGAEKRRTAVRSGAEIMRLARAAPQAPPRRRRPVS